MVRVDAALNTLMAGCRAEWFPGAFGMRVAAFLVCLALAGCNEPMVQMSGDTDDAASALQSESEKACAQMTNNVPDKLRTMSAETQALVRREFKLCVDAVTKGDPSGEPVERVSDEPPGLRGHTEAPPS